MVAGSFLGLLGITGPNSLDNSSVLLMGLDADVSITDIPEKYQLILRQQAVIKLIKEAVFAAFGTETVESMSASMARTRLPESIASLATARQ